MVFFNDYLEPFIVLIYLYLLWKTSDKYDKAIQEQKKALKEQNQALILQNDFIKEMQTPQYMVERLHAFEELSKIAAESYKKEIQELKNEKKKSDDDLEKSKGENQDLIMKNNKLSDEINRREKEFRKYMGLVTDYVKSNDLSTGSIIDISGSAIFNDYINHIKSQDTIIWSQNWSSGLFVDENGKLNSTDEDNNES